MPVRRKAQPSSSKYKPRSVSYSRAAPAKKVAVRRKPAQSRYLAPLLASGGGLLGGYLGGPGGAHFGSLIGNAAGHGIKALTGFGDYQVKKNSLLSPGAPPAVANGALAGGSIVVSHREYLGDVISSSSANTFHLRAYDINVGLAATFPWLGQLAPNFQQYKIMGMAFEYRTMSADALNSTNTALGQVIMATNYDALSTNFQSKGEMENSAYAQSVKPSSSCLHLIECDTSTLPISELYIRSGAIASGSDKRMYDLGKFQIATNGFQGTSVNCGELWVTYQVMLLKPKIYDGLGEDVEYYTSFQSTGITNSLPLGTVADMVVPPIAPYTGTTNNLAVTFDSNLAIRMPGSAIRKYYNITLLYQGDATASLIAPVLTFTNALADNGQFSFNGGSTMLNDFQAPTNGVSLVSSRFVVVSGFRTNGNGQDIIITLGTAGTLPANATSLQIIINELPYDARANK